MEERLRGVIDQFCEPHVTKTNDHPNCEYVFSCEEMEMLEKIMRTFIQAEKLLSRNEALEEAIRVVENGPFLAVETPEGYFVSYSEIIRALFSLKTK